MSKNSGDGIVVRTKCPSCYAEISVNLDNDKVRCDYCRSILMVEKTKTIGANGNEITDYHLTKAKQEQMFRFLGGITLLICVLFAKSAMSYDLNRGMNAGVSIAAGILTVMFVTLVQIPKEQKTLFNGKLKKSAFVGICLLLAVVCAMAAAAIL